MSPKTPKKQQRSLPRKWKPRKVLLLRVRAAHAWQKLVGTIENIPVLLGKPFGKRAVRELKWELGGYLKKTIRRGKIKHVAAEAIKDLAERFGREHNMRIRYTLLSRLKRSKSVLEKIEKKRKQFDGIFTIVKKNPDGSTVAVNAGEVQEMHEALERAMDEGNLNFARTLSKQLSSFHYVLDYASVMRALRPDEKGRSILDYFLLSTIWQALRLPLRKTIKDIPEYERIQSELSRLNRAFAEVVRVANKFPLRREELVQRARNKYIPLIGRDVLLELVRRRVLMESIGARLIFSPPRRGEGFVEKPGLVVFERKADKPFALQEKLNKLFAEYKTPELDLPEEIGLAKRIEQGVTVGYHYYLALPQGKGISRRESGYSWDGEREAFVVKRSTLEAIGEEKILETLNAFAGEGKWSRNRTEESTLQQVYDFIKVLPFQQVVVDGERKPLLQQTIRVRDFNRVPAIYGYPGIHVLLATPLGEFELQLRTLQNQITVGRIDEMRKRKQGIKSYK